MSARFLRILMCASLFAFQSAVLADHTEVAERYSHQRQLFKELTDQLQSGELDAAIARRDELKGYPLKEYFDYLVVRHQLKQSANPASLLERVAEFNGDTRLQRRLLGVLKNRSVALERWQDYKLAWADDNSPDHPCDDLLAGFINGQPKRFTEPTRKLWSDVGRHTANCDKAFSMLLAEVTDVPTTALWQRTVALVKRGDLEAAGSLLKYFNARDKRLVTAWIDGYDDPAAALRNEVTHGNTVHHKVIAELMLRRWARDDLPGAVAYWQQNATRFGFNEKEANDAVAGYAVLAAKRGIAESRQLLETVAPNRDVRYWRVRLALQAKDWPRCIATLDELTKQEQSMPRWQYWRARCLELQGFQSAANRIFEAISDKFEYYGFLAADRLSHQYAIQAAPLPDADSAMHELKDDPRVIRALEYFFAGLPWEGRREWNRALKGSSKERFLGAAQLADSVDWHDRALDSAFSAGATDVLPWLFPEAYKEDVTRHAASYDVPREFVYGVMRRESRFTPDIKSSAGAVGLMQLMPATARQMGNELSIKAPVWRLIDSELNIKLGIRYLHFVLSRFDNNLAYAAAAYNAGPKRVKKWLQAGAAGALETDIWVELIPFDETRAYVQAVLFNTTVSEWMLKDGQVTRLENRMNSLSVSQLAE